MRLAPMIAILGCAAFAAAATAPVYGQEGFPSRPLTFIVPFPPGGAADLSARPLSTAMERVLKQPIAILNRPGASGAVGMAAAANSKPDGYTILHTLVSFNTVPEVDDLFSRKPAFSRDQFTPIALIAADPPILVVGAEQPWKTLVDLLTDAKKRPGQILYSSSGLYGPSHVPMEMFIHATGIRLRHLPAVGGPPAMTAVLGGHATMWASPPAMAAPHAQAGKLRLFASWGAQRHPYFRDIPTFKELGYDIEYYLWVGQFAPAAVPAPVLKTLRDAVRQAVQDPDFKTAMDKAQTPIAFKEGAEFQKFLEDDARTLAAVIKRIGRIEEKKDDKK